VKVIGQDNQIVDLQSSKFSSHPSLQQLEGMIDDPRVASNLGMPSTTTTNIGWLAPLASSLNDIQPSSSPSLTSSLSSEENEVNIAFERPHVISALKFFNYSKTPTRGARDISLYMDGLLVISTSLAAASSSSSSSSSSHHQTILFTNDKGYVNQESKFVRYCGQNEQDVMCIDEKVIKVKPSSTPPPINFSSSKDTPGHRPKTSARD
jgi:protein JBTS26